MYAQMEKFLVREWYSIMVKEENLEAVISAGRDLGWKPWSVNIFGGDTTLSVVLFKCS